MSNNNNHPKQLPFASSYFRRLNMSTNNQVQIIVNGRCQPNPGLGGYAAVLSTTNNGKPVERIISGTIADVNNQRVQLLAVAEALEALKAPCKVELTTYSQYVVNGMTEWIDTWLENGWLTSKRKPVKNDDLWKRINAACQKHEVTFNYVQWNSSDDDAKRLDSLVKQARDGQPEEPVSEPESDGKPANEKPYRLMVAGSRRTSENMLEYACRVVARAIECNWQIVVGDNPDGVDTEIVKECNRRKYTNVIVVGIARKPRNGGVNNSRYIQIGKSYTERDQMMAKASDRMLGIWDGKSAGTKKGYQFAKSQGKTAHLMDFAGTFA
jgi:ribonuclease HI